MKLCWKDNSEARPTFEDIATCLSCHLQSYAGYLAMNDNEVA